MTADRNAPREIDPRLRVLTWNIWWQFGDWRRRALAITDAVAATNADVIAVQEVWAQGDTDQARELGASIGFHHVYAPWRDLDGVGFGNAVLSRWPISGHEVLTYSVAEAGLHRLAVRADIEGPHGEIQVFSTHLNWGFDDGARRVAQVGELLEFVARSHRPNSLQLVCGDFNARPASNEMKLMAGTDLVDVWSLLHPGEPGWTWEQSNPHVEDHMEPDRRIDYVFARRAAPNGRGDPIEVSLLRPDPQDEYPASDHHGVVVDLRY